MKAQVAEISQSTSENMRLAPCVSSPGQHEKLLVNVRRTDYGTGLNLRPCLVPRAKIFALESY